MKRNAWIAAAIAASMLSAGTAAAESNAKVENRAKVQKVATRSTQVPARRVVPFQSDRTESWLCNYVSVFFCSDVIPSLTVTSPNNTGANQVPDRSRRTGQ